MVKDWKFVKIGELLDFKNGLNKGKDFFGSGTPIINYMDVYKKNGLHRSDIAGKVSLDEKEIERYEIRKGDVFFTRTSETPEEVGLASVMLDDIDSCVFSGFVLRGRPKTDMLLPEYCKYCFSTHEVRQKIIASCTYTTRALTNGTQLSKIEILVPNKEEQFRIAASLTAVDQLIDKFEILIRKYQSLKIACLQHMFPRKGQTKPDARLPGFTGPWEQRKLGDFGAVAMCKRIFKDQTSEKGDIPFYKIGTFGGVPDAYIPRELFNEYKQMYPYPEKGDILISASGSIGRTVEYTGEDTYFQDSNIVWLRHDKSIVNLFLKYLYEVIQWAGIEGSTIKRLYNDNILTTEVMIPSVQEQEKIGAYLDSIDHLITLHQRMCEKYKKIKQGMMEELLSGKIRLI